jgi:hypothetical protein
LTNFTKINLFSTLSQHHKSTLFKRWTFDVETTLVQRCSTSWPKFNLKTTLKQRGVPAGLLRFCCVYVCAYWCPTFYPIKCRSEFLVVMSAMIFTSRRCSVSLYLQLFGGVMSYLRYFCLQVVNMSKLQQFTFSVVAAFYQI